MACMHTNGNAAETLQEVNVAHHLHSVPKVLSEEEKIAVIRQHFGKIMKTLGLDMNDDSLRDTPQRVAKMFVKEVFSGLDERNFPTITTFANTYGYTEMLVEKDITLHSFCEHHFLPIIGKAHVAYFPGKKVVGLSKLNRLVGYYAKRPQVQERLTMQIARCSILMACPPCGGLAEGDGRRRTHDVLIIPEVPFCLFSTPNVQACRVQEVHCTHRFI